MRGALGLNWKPARFGDGFIEKDDWISIEPFMDQVDQLDKVDYIQLHLNESNLFSHSHAAPHDRIESVMGDKLIVPRAASNKDPFGDWLTACKDRGLKTMIYVHSGCLVYGDEKIAARWQVHCDSDETIQTFIKSEAYHSDPNYPNRHLMFAYGEFVLKEYSQRYGELIDSWCFDKAKLIAENGDLLGATVGVEDQRLFENWANACRAGNPDAAVAFNHGVGTAKNPFAQVTRVADFTFGHPFGGIGDMAGTESLYKRNFRFCEIMKETSGRVYDRGEKKRNRWNQKVIGHFDPKMSTRRWNAGKKPGLTKEQFLQWNQVGLSGGAITWGVPLNHPECNKPHKAPNLVATPREFKSEVQRLSNSRGVKDFFGCSPVQALPGSIIELCNGGRKLLGGDFCEVCIFGEILPKQPIGVFIGTSLPAAIRMSEVDARAQAGFNVFEV